MFFRSKKSNSPAPADKQSEAKAPARAAAVAPARVQQAAASSARSAPSAAKPVGGKGMLAGNAAGKSIVVRRGRATAGYDPALGMLTHLLMASPQFQRHSLSDLSWLVIPALRAKQAMIAVAPGKGLARRTPTAAILWATVSADVDRRLSAMAEQGLRLQPEDWKSGSIVWIVASVGGPQAVERLLRKLMDGPLKGRAIKMVVRANGRPKVVIVDAKQAGRA